MIIEAHNASLVYRDGTEALKPFSLSIGQGDLALITGPSGSGKTSLLKLMLGMEFATTGSFSVLGTALKAGQGPAVRSLRQQIGPVFQEFRLLAGRTVMDNVLLGMRFLPVTGHEMKARAQEAVQRVGLGPKCYQKVDYLSWGECQRVAIARAVARRPALIIADEPTGNLDHDNALNILRLLSDFCTPDTGVVITTHATHLIDAMAPGLHIRMEAGNLSVERRGRHG